MFSKKVMFQKRKFSYFSQSICYSNVVLTKQIYFSHTFVKSWVHISHQIATLAGGSQHNYKRYKHGNFSLII